MTEPYIIKPLAGVRIIELARILAGPWCGQLLADLGAEVIKVERPGVGDDTRQWGPPFISGPDGRNLGAAYYHSTNRGKSSVSIDIGTQEGQAEVRRLVATADVVIENYKVGGLARYALDHASLIKVKPDIITCSITGFGQDGPYAHQAGYDFIAQGLGGGMSLNGQPGGPALKTGVAYIDIFTGLYSAVAILAALHRRAETGLGAHIDTALLDTQVAVIANQAVSWMVTGNVPEQLGNSHPNLAPYQTFYTKDGEIIIAVGNDRQFGKLCDVLETDLANDRRFATNPQRVINRHELAAKLQASILEWKKSALATRLIALGVPAGPINRIDEVFADPQVNFRGMAIERDGVPGVATPIVIDGQRMVSSTGSPALAD